MSRPVPRPLRTVVAQTSPTALVVEPTLLPSSAQRETRHHFTFDRVFHPEATQVSVYNASVEPLVRRFLDGYNTTVFAYGQTSSGKSYSMGTSEASEEITEDEALQGDLDDTIGIIPRAAVQIFESLKNDDDAQSEYTLQASFLELYNEDLIDLLADPDVDAPNQVQIRETRAGEIVWTGLRQRQATCVSDVVALLQNGMAIRQTHETEMNTQSSRSHAIFSLSLTRKRKAAPDRARSALGGAASPERAMQTPATPLAPRTPRSGLPTLGARSAFGFQRAATPTRPMTPTRPAQTPRPRRSDEEMVVTTSKLHFVDLAGSERLKRTAATGDRVREGISINSGLHALGNVISTLSDPVKARRATHIPYRDSKLTRLLQDSLGGNAHTLMIACISMVEANVNETLNTLHYAQRARHIRNTVERNQTEAGWGSVEYLQAQVLRLRKELELVRSSNELIMASPEKRSPSMVHSDAEQELLAWQEKYSALSRKNVQLTAELIHLDRQQAAQRTGSAPDFLASAEPVIVEYEKTVDSLEGQLNVMKASLASSEELLLERERALTKANDRAAHAESQLDALRQTVRDLHERLGVQGEPKLGLGQPSSTPPRRTMSSDGERSFGGVLDYARDSARRPSDARRYRVSLTSRASADATPEGSPQPAAGLPAGRPDVSADSVQLRTQDTSDDSMLLRPSQDGLDMVAAAERELRQLNMLLEASTSPPSDPKTGESMNRVGNLLHWVQQCQCPNATHDGFPCRTCGSS